MYNAGTKTLNLYRIECVINDFVKTCWLFIFHNVSMRLTQYTYKWLEAAQSIYLEFFFNNLFLVKIVYINLSQIVHRMFNNSIYKSIDEIVNVAVVVEVVAPSLAALLITKHISDIRDLDIDTFQYEKKKKNIQ